MQDSVLSSNQEYSAQAMAHFLGRKDRTKKKAFFSKWLGRY